MRIKLCGDLDVVGPELISKDVCCAFDERIDGDNFPFRHMLAGKAQQVLHDLLAAFSAFVDHVKMAFLLGIDLAKL